MIHDTVKTEERARELIILAINHEAKERNAVVNDVWFSNYVTSCQCGQTLAVRCTAMTTNGTIYRQCAVCERCGDDSNGEEIIY